MHPTAHNPFPHPHTVDQLLVNIFLGYHNISLCKYSLCTIRVCGPTRRLCSRNLGIRTSPHTNIGITMFYVSVYATVMHVSVYGPSRRFGSANMCIGPTISPARTRRRNPRQIHRRRLHLLHRSDSEIGQSSFPSIHRSVLHRRHLHPLYCIYVTESLRSYAHLHLKEAPTVDQILALDQW